LWSESRWPSGVKVCPPECFLRSAPDPDWHLDPAGEHTLIVYLEERGIDPLEVSPLPVGLFIDYAEWFQKKAGIEVLPDLVCNLSKPNSHFEATLESGRRVTASTMVAAPGIIHFAVIPEWVERCLSPKRWSHTSHRVQLDELRGKRYLVIGGGQSAFEWGALLADEGAEEIHIRLPARYAGVFGIGLEFRGRTDEAYPHGSWLVPQLADRRAGGDN
jgi:hypothetical protein